LCDEWAKAEETVQHGQNNNIREDCSTTTDKINPPRSIKLSSKDMGREEGRE
jgi:hypothetical protein